MPCSVEILRETFAYLYLIVPNDLFEGRLQKTLKCYVSSVRQPLSDWTATAHQFVI